MSDGKSAECVAALRCAAEGSPSHARTLLDQLPFMAWMKDERGAFLMINEPFARACGVPRDEILGRTDHDVWPAELAVRYVADDRRVMASRTSALVEEPIAETSGTRWFETYKAPVVDEHDRVVGTAGFARDVTARREAAERERAREAQAHHAQKLESLGLLAGGIAHDFNNLLVGVLANAEIALRQLQALGDQARGPIERVQDVRLAALRAADLTRQMLAYSGRSSFVVERIDLDEVVRELAKLLQASISKKATLRCELAGGLPKVVADVTQIRQVIMNLITNASDALRDAPGTICVSTGVEVLSEPPPGEPLDARPFAPGPYVFLDIEDDGCGMSEETRARLFEPFYSTKSTGHGLGLSAVQGIVRGHRGAITIDSAVGRGTRMRILFPAAEGGPSPTPRPPVVGGEWRGSGLVLLADDEPFVRDVTRDMLRELGFDVVCARDGREAIARFRERAHEIAVVLLDLKMPDLHGHEVLEELRRIRPDLRVVFCSGYDERETERAASAEGVVGFLQKPYTLDALEERLRAALDRRAR